MVEGGSAGMLSSACGGDGYKLLALPWLDSDKAKEHHAVFHHLIATKKGGERQEVNQLLAEATVVQLPSGAFLLSCVVVTDFRKDERLGGDGTDTSEQVVGALLVKLCHYAEQLVECRPTASWTEESVSERLKKSAIFAFAPLRCSTNTQRDGVVCHIHRCLYAAGFRQVELCQPPLDEDHLLLVFQPDCLPNYLCNTVPHHGLIQRSLVNVFCEDVACLCDNVNTQRANIGTGKTSKFTLPNDDGDMIVVNADLPWFLPEQAAHWPDQVIVVGGGISGLAACTALAEAGRHVVLLEASNYIGGRVQQHDGWPGFAPVDMGGEFIEGECCNALRLATQHGWPFCKVYVESLDDQWVENGKCYVWADSKLVPLWDSSSPVMFDAMHAWDEILEPYGKEVFEEHETQKNQVGTASEQSRTVDSPTLVDQSFRDLLEAAGVSKTACGILRGVIAQTDGASFDSCSAAIEYQNQELWSYGNSVFRLTGSNRLLLHHLLYVCHQRQVDIRLNNVVTAVDYSGDGVVVSTSSSTPVKGSQVIVTVPLQVLKRNVIQFTPELSPAKHLAVKKICMDPAIKVCCRFRCSFWPTDAAVIFTASGFLSQYWTCTQRVLPSTKSKERKAKFTCTCSSNVPFDARDVLISCKTSHDCLRRDYNVEHDGMNLVANHGGVLRSPAEKEVPEQSTDGCSYVDCRDLEIAEEAVVLPDKEVVERMLDHLDEIHRVTLSSLGLTSSREVFMGALVCKWDESRAHIHGGYSSPTVGCLGMRSILAEPVGSKLFFGGEATHDEVASIQIAWDTGLRAANEVLSLT